MNILLGVGYLTRNDIPKFYLFFCRIYDVSFPSSTHFPTEFMMSLLLLAEYYPIVQKYHILFIHWRASGLFPVSSYYE